MRQAWLKLQFAFRLLLPIVLQVYHLPPLLPLPVSNSAHQLLFESCCTILLYFSRYCTISLLFFICCVLFVWKVVYRTPTPVFLPGESQGRGSLVDCRLRGRTESDTTEATWQQQQQQCSKNTITTERLNWTELKQTLQEYRSLPEGNPLKAGCFSIFGF